MLLASLDARRADLAGIVDSGRVLQRDARAGRQQAAERRDRTGMGLDEGDRVPPTTSSPTTSPSVLAARASRP